MTFKDLYNYVSIKRRRKV